MLIKAERSGLLIVDMQEKLLPHVHEHQRVTANCVWLLELAQAMAVPVLMSEQYPKGLGSTVEAVSSHASAKARMDKVHFSCVDEDKCMDRIASLERQQFVVAGIEAHVCVLQTAVNLAEAGKQVFVVADAIGSRSPRDYELGIERMRRAGLDIVTKEMVLFEWAHKAGTPEFKELSKRFLQ